MEFFAFPRRLLVRIWSDGAGCGKRAWPSRMSSLGSPPARISFACRQRLTSTSCPRVSHVAPRASLVCDRAVPHAVPADTVVVPVLDVGDTDPEMGFGWLPPACDSLC